MDRTELCTLQLAIAGIYPWAHGHRLLISVCFGSKRGFLAVLMRPLNVITSNSLPEPCHLTRCYSATTVCDAVWSEFWPGDLDAGAEILGTYRVVAAWGPRLSGRHEADVRD